MTLKAQVARGMKWKVITMVGRHVISFFIFTTLARLLDPSAFGLVGLVGVYLAFVNMFVDQGIGMAIVQREKLEPDHLHTAFWFNMGCGLVLAVGTIALANPIAEMFGESELIPLLRWSSIGLLLGAASEVQNYLLIRDMDFRRPAIRILLGSVTGGVVGVSMAFLGFGVWALIGQQLASAAASTIFLWIAAPYRPNLRFSPSHLRELLGVSLSVFISSLLWLLTSRIDQLIIGRFSGVSNLGLYVVGGKFPDLAKNVIHNGIADVTLPALSRLQGDHPRLCRVIYKGMELNALVSFAVYVGFAAVAPTLLPLAFGPQWEPATPLMQLTSIYTLILGLFVYCQPALLASGGPGRYVLVNIAGAFGAAVACIIGIQYSVSALIVGLIINITLIGLIALFFLRNRVGLSPWLYCRPIMVPAMASAIMYLAVCSIKSAIPNNLSPWASLLIQVLSGACAYVATLFVFARASLTRLWEIAMHAINRKSVIA